MIDDTNQGNLGRKELPSPIFAKVMEHLIELSTIHGQIDPQTDAGSELLEKIEARMLKLFDGLPEGQIA